MSLPTEHFSMEIPDRKKGEIVVDSAHPRTLADKVFNNLQEAIVCGNMPPGTKVSEAELAKQYGISRGPLREAINRLESRKLLVRQAHVGARVVSLSIEELLDIYYTREALEGMACRLAAENMTTEEIAGLRDLLENHRQQSELQSGRAYFQHEGDLDFHYRIAKGSRNQFLSGILCSDLYHLVRLYRYRFSDTKGRPQKAFSEHQHIIDAIENKDGELAELLMRRHISRARINIEQRFKSDHKDMV